MNQSIKICNTTHKGVVTWLILLQLAAARWQKLSHFQILKNCVFLNETVTEENKLKFYNDSNTVCNSLPYTVSAFV